MIDEKDIEAQVREWERQAEEHRKLADELERKVAFARDLLQSVGRRGAVSTEPKGRPSLMKATLELIQKHPAGISVESMLMELRNRGFTGGVKAGLKASVFSAINRLRQSHEIRTIDTSEGKGYRYVKEKERKVVML